MKELNNYIIEKLKLNKDSEDPEYIKFCDALGIEDSKAAKKLYKYYNTDDCEKKLEGYFDGIHLNSTCFDLLLMLSVILIDDNMDYSDIMILGYKSYKGKNNPYDFSWFDEKNSKGETPLDILQALYRGNNDDWFKNYFAEFFQIVKNCGKISIDDVWYMWDKMLTPESEWPEKEKEEWN